MHAVRVGISELRSRAPNLPSSLSYCNSFSSLTQSHTPFFYYINPSKPLRSFSTLFSLPPISISVPSFSFLPSSTIHFYYYYYYYYLPFYPGPMDVNPVRSNPVGEPKTSKPHSQPPPLLLLYLTNAVFVALFFSVAHFILHRWRDKIRSSTPLHSVTFSEIAAILSLLFSFIYLTSFFSIGLMLHPFISSYTHRSSPSSPSSSTSSDEDKDDGDTKLIAKPIPQTKLIEQAPSSDEDIVNSVVSGTVPSYSLESKLGDCNRAAVIRRTAVEKVTKRSLEGLPVEGFDYESILGQCCEMPIGYVQIPVGVAGPLLLDGKEYTVPMATTEGCLVASTNRGCKAIHVSGGASSEVLRDSMTRAPVVRFGSAKRAAQLKFYLEDPENFDSLSVVFNK